MNSNDKLLNKLSGLPDDVTISGYDKHGSDIIEIYVAWNEPKGKDRICPSCSAPWCVKKDNGKKRVGS